MAETVIQDGFSQLQDDNPILLYASDANVYAFFAFFSLEKTLYISFWKH